MDVSTERIFTVPAICVTEPLPMFTQMPFDVVVSLVNPCDLSVLLVDAVVKDLYCTMQCAENGIYRTKQVNDPQKRRREGEKSGSTRNNILSEKRERSTLGILKRVATQNE